MNIASFVVALRQANTLMQIATDPAAQFGTATRRYIGAELLPERTVTVNDYIETKINYRTQVANNGTRYSPSQKKGGVYTGSFPVHLAHSDIASEFTSQDYDALVDVLAGAARYQGPLLQTPPGMAAVAQITNWFNTVIVRALIELNEVQRWQAMIDGTVTLTGDNGYNDTVTYPRYADLHGPAGGNWSNNAYDPFTDIFNRAQAMGNRGVTPVRFIMGNVALNKFLNNTNVRARVGKVVVSTSGQISGTPGRATLADVNSVLAEDGLPPIEQYNLMYQTTTGAKFFLRRDAAILVGGTGQSEVIDLGNAQYETIENTIGYTGVGRAAGQAVSGRYVRADSFENKPPRIEGEGWQTSLPVITAPEAFSTITSIA